MEFNSYIFVLLFLPLSVFGYFFLHRVSTKAQNIWLLLTSFIFYLYNGLRDTLLILLTIVVNYFLYSRIRKTNKKSYLNLGIGFNILFLIIFKYFGFLSKLFNNLSLSLAMPLAISFYTFSNISFLVDVYRNEIEDVSLFEYALYVLFFPKILQGPITSYNELMSQFKDNDKRNVNWDNLSQGAISFILGLSKKILLADIFAKAADFGFSNIDVLDTTNAIFVVLAYTFQIYFDFSGYSDMAIGISQMFNIDIMDNFDSPYVAENIDDFWKRWHISLTTFFRKYVYIPLGGNRKGKLRTYLNVLIVFILSGIWHGSTLNYFLWGVANGILVILCKTFKNKLKSFGKIASWMITFLIINVLWTLFRSQSVNDFLSITIKVLQLHIGDINYDISSCFALKEFRFLEELIFGMDIIGTKHYMAFYYLVAMFIIFGCKIVKEVKKGIRYNCVSVIILTILLLWCVLSFSGIKTFIYQFY